MNGNKTQTR